LQALRREQIDACISSDGERLASLHTALQLDATLQQLATSPLVLRTMTLAYRDTTAEELLASDTPENARTQLFAAYVNAMFRRGRPQRPYSDPQTLRWLAWLAAALTRQSQTIFYIDQLQPSWLDQRAAHVAYAVVDRFGGTLVVWALVALPVAILLALGGSGLRESLAGGGLFALIPAFSAGAFGGAQAARVNPQLADSPITGRSVMAGVAGGTLGAIGAGVTASWALGLGAVSAAFGLVFGFAGFWLCYRLSVGPWPGGRRGAHRALVRGVIGGVLGATLGFVLEFAVEAANFANEQHLDLPMALWRVAATASRWLRLTSWPNALSDEAVVGMLFGLAIGLVSGLVAGAPHENSAAGGESPSSERSFVPSAAAGSVALGIVGGVVGWLLSLVAGSPSELSFMFALQTAAVGVLVGGLAGGPGFRGRQIVVVEPKRWSTGTAVLSGLRGLLVGLCVGTVIGGISIGLWTFWGSSPGDPFTTGSGMDPKAALVGTIKGATFFGVVLGLLFTAVFAVALGPAVDVLEPSLLPDQRLARSARRALLVGAATCLAYAVVNTGIALTLTLDIEMSTLIAGSVVVGLTYGVCMALSQGGYACLSHIALRIVLWQFDALPPSTIRFLDYATERVFLRKVGGSYIFVHRLLQEYFANQAIDTR
jgi:hypothetical protein